jgi:hypothetical protein
MDFVQTSRWSVATAVVVVAAVATGCGSQDEDTGEPPTIEEPQIGCEAVDGVNDGDPVVTSVSVRVTDPDRDLVTDEGALTGTFEGLAIELTDEDADQRFSWEPSDERSGIECQGTHQLMVEARDAEGRETIFDEEISRDEGS